MTGEEREHAAMVRLVGAVAAAEGQSTYDGLGEAICIALKITKGQAAALMSGEAAVAEKRVVSLGRYWFEHGADASEKVALEDERNHLANNFGHGSFADGQTRDRLAAIDAELAASPASEKETT